MIQESGLNTYLNCIGTGRLPVPIQFGYVFLGGPQIYTAIFWCKWIPIVSKSGPVASFLNTATWMQGAATAHAHSSMELCRTDPSGPLLGLKRMARRSLGQTYWQWKQYRCVIQWSKRPLLWSREWPLWIPLAPSCTTLVRIKRKYNILRWSKRSRT